MWRRTYRAVPGTTTEVYTSSSANPSFAVPIDVRLRCCLRTRLCAPKSMLAVRARRGFERHDTDPAPFVRSKSVDIGHPPLPLPLRPAHAPRRRRAKGQEPRRHRALRGGRHERPHGERTPSLASVTSPSPHFAFRGYLTLPRFVWRIAGSFAPLRVPFSDRTGRVAT